MRTPTKKIRVMIVDDSELVRMGLKTVLAIEPEIEIVAEASSIAQAQAVLEHAQPSVMLLDIRLPDGSGLDACPGFLKQRPDIRILVLSSVADQALVEQAIQAGAHGYLLKEIDSRRLVQAITDVAAGHSAMDPGITARLLELVRTGGAQSLSILSPQERRVIALIAEGRTNKEIGSELGLSDKTVKNYLSNIFEKLKISRRSEAAALYIRSRSPG